MQSYFYSDNLKWLSGKELSKRWPGVTPDELVGRIIECLDAEECGVDIGTLNASIHIAHDEKSKETVPGPCWSKRDLKGLLQEINDADLKETVENGMFFNLHDVKAYELDDPNVLKKPNDHYQEKCESKTAQKADEPTHAGKLNLEPDTDRSFLRKGEYWEVKFNGKSTTLKNLGRIRYILHLLEKPNENFSPERLSATIKGGTPDPDSNYLKMSVEQLEKEGLISLDDTDINGLSHDEQERLKEMIVNFWGKYNENRNENNLEKWQTIKQYISKEYNLSCVDTPSGPRFKYRKKASRRYENARINVQKSIKRTIDDIRKVLPELADHLDGSIKTGSSPSYTPDKIDPEWFIQW